MFQTPAKGVSQTADDVAQMVWQTIRISSRSNQIKMAAVVIIENEN